MGLDAGHRPLVRVFDGSKGTFVAEFEPFPPTFRGGVRVAIGDPDDKSRLKIVCAPGSGREGLAHPRAAAGRQGPREPRPVPQPRSGDVRGEPVTRGSRHPRHRLAHRRAAGDVDNPASPATMTGRTNTGCSSAWLERLVRDQEVAGSNPVSPTDETAENPSGRSSFCLPRCVPGAASERRDLWNRSTDRIGGRTRCPAPQPHPLLPPPLAVRPRRAVWTDAAGGRHYKLLPGTVRRRRVPHRVRPAATRTRGRPAPRPQPPTPTG